MSLNHLEKVGIEASPFEPSEILRCGVVCGKVWMSLVHKCMSLVSPSTARRNAVQALNNVVSSATDHGRRPLGEYRTVGGIIREPSCEGPYSTPRIESRQSDLREPLITTCCRPMASGLNPLTTGKTYLVAFQAGDREMSTG